MGIANLMTDQLETLLQQPGAPNLYWSLTVLPEPFADLRPALYEETLWLDNMFPWLKKIEATPMSAAVCVESAPPNLPMGVRTALTM